MQGTHLKPRALGLSWYLNRYSERGQDAQYSYGYRRYSLLGALTSAGVLVVGSVAVLAEAVPRLLAPEPANAPGMALIAVVGIAVNGVAALRVRGGQSLNVRMVAWHLLEDVLGWAVILIVSIVLFFTDWYILDPLLSIVVTVYVLVNVLRNLRKTIALFLQATPDAYDVAALDAQIAELPGANRTHHTHVWSLDGDHHVLSTHVVVEDALTRAESVALKADIRTLAHVRACEHITIEIEFGDDDCSI